MPCLDFTELSPLQNLQFLFGDTCYYLNQEYQGRIQDFKLEGGRTLKIIARRGARRENCWGISCEKSLFYAKKSYSFPILGGRGPEYDDFFDRQNYVKKDVCSPIKRFKY